MRVVLVNGCFDLLHDGHVYFLKEARSLGDWLVVALNTDESVRAQKGANRPAVPFARRMASLLELWCVNDVVASDGPAYKYPITPAVVAYGRDVSRAKEAANHAALAALYPQSTIAFIAREIGPSTTAQIAARES